MRLALAVLLGAAGIGGALGGWSRDESTTPLGRVLPLSVGGLSNALAMRAADGRAVPVLRRLPPSTHAEQVGDPAEGCVVISADVDADGTSDAAGGWLQLGALTCARLVALSRVKRWWMAPSFGCCAADVPRETQMLLVELRAGGPYVLFLPIIDGDVRATLTGAPAVGTPARLASNRLCLELHAGGSDAEGARPRARARHAVVCAAGTDPHELLSRGVRAAAACMRGSFAPRPAKRAPDALDLFGWCTWDAFYEAVRPEGVVSGVRTLRAAGVPVRWLILDDGWQDIEPPLPDSAPASPESRGAAASAPAQPAQLQPPPQQLPAEAGAGEAQGGADGAPGAPREASGASTDSTGGGPLAAAFGACASAIERWYQARVAHAPADARAVRLWRRLVSWGPARAALHAQLEATTTFTRRLSSARANSKFEQPAPKHMAPPPDTSDAGAGGGAAPPYAGAAGARSPPGGTDRAEARASLAGLVRALKGEHGVQRVYAWHALGGYWSGVSANQSTSALARECAPVRVVMPTPAPALHAVEPPISWDGLAVGGVGVAQPGAPLRALYAAMHGYLRAAGIDGVKTDVQAALGTLELQQPGGGAGGGSARAGGQGRLSGVALARAYVEACEASVASHFPAPPALGDDEAGAGAGARGGGDDGAPAAAAARPRALGIVHCMCHGTETLYRYAQGCVIRAADDFFPEQPLSQTVHIAHVAYNSLLLGELGVPDWDMFHSAAPSGGLHSAARAISGGPVYVSDAPGVHDGELLRQLVTPRGNVLRASRHAAPTSDCLFADVRADGASALKLWNVNGAGGCVLGAFNLQGVTWDHSQHANVVTDSAGVSVLVAVSPLDAPPLLAAAAERVRARPHARRRARWAAAARAAARTAAGADAPPAAEEPRTAAFAVHAHRSGVLRLMEINAAHLGAREAAARAGAHEPPRRAPRRRPSVLKRPARADAAEGADAPRLRPAASEAGDSIEIVLEPGGWELFTLAPVHDVALRARVAGASVRVRVRWACVGLRRMLNGGAAVLRSALHEVREPAAAAALAAAARTARDSRALSALVEDTRAPRWWEVLLGLRTAAAVRAVALATVRGSGELLCYCSHRPRAVVLRSAGAEADAAADGGADRGAAAAAAARDAGARVVRWSYEPGSGALRVHIPEPAAPGGAGCVAHRTEPIWQLVVLV